MLKSYKSINGKNEETYMSDTPYYKLFKEDLILRDHLAIDRTILANERTFLAYIRTALTFLLGGITLIKFFNSITADILGWFCIPLGVTTLTIGILRYKKMAKQIHSARITDY